MHCMASGVMARKQCIHVQYGHGFACSRLSACRTHSLCVSYYSDATSMKAKVVFPLSLVPRIVQDSSWELRRCAECTKETPFCAFWCPRTDSHIRAVFSLPCFGLCCVSVLRHCSSRQREAPSEHVHGS